MEAIEAAKTEGERLQEALSMVVGWNDSLRPYLQEGPWVVTDHDGQRWTVASDGRRMVWIAGEYFSRDLEASVADPESVAYQAHKFLDQSQRDYLAEGLHRRYAVDADALREFCDVPARYHCPSDAHILDEGAPRAMVMGCTECHGSGELMDEADDSALFAGGSIILNRRLIAGVIHRLPGGCDMLAAGTNDPVQFRGEGWRLAVMPCKWLQQGESAPVFQGERP